MTKPKKPHPPLLAGIWQPGARMGVNSARATVIEAGEVGRFDKDGFLKELASKPRPPMKPKKKKKTEGNRFVE